MASAFGARAADLLGNTENYLPGGVADWFGKNNTRSQVGKHFASAFGWDFDFKPGTMQMGKGNGWMGSKILQKHGAHKAFLTVGTGFKRAAFSGMASLFFTGYDAYLGYQEEGVWGAVKGAGEGMLIGAAFNKAIPAVFGPGWQGAKAGFALGRGIGAAGGMGNAIRHARSGMGAAKATSSTALAVRTAGVGNALVKAGTIGRAATAGGLAGWAWGIGLGGVGAVTATLLSPISLAVMGATAVAGQAADFYERGTKAGMRERQVRNLEMGAPVADPFGTISTLRQRSLSALQNSHVNGRMALGNEAALLHSSF
ncbi:MAG: hypothetical protein CMB80_03525 [Flammeovirgaceae bacterium]|nr:hypothetical protein [Flammeovirgaceae bacterium]|tara:strand:+ start:6771 stop:7709 length:939 start_codon:yes stop_codon:yes gene_type:complete